MTRPPGIQEYFKAVICGDEIRHAKPWPDIFICAAKRLGTGCGNTIVFEDSVNGIEAAYRAGCIPVMVPDLTVPDEAVQKKCFCVINSLCEAEALFDSCSAAGRSV